MTAIAPTTHGVLLIVVPGTVGMHIGDVSVSIVSVAPPLRSSAAGSVVAMQTIPNDP